jgi:hypothetical protein
MKNFAITLKTQIKSQKDYALCKDLNLSLAHHNFKDVVKCVGN